MKRGFLEIKIRLCYMNKRYDRGGQACIYKCAGVNDGRGDAKGWWDLLAENLEAKQICMLTEVVL